MTVEGRTGYGMPRMKKTVHYPDETNGSRLAVEARRKANALTAEQRREHFNKAMVLIYGGHKPKEAARAGR